MEDSEKYTHIDAPLKAPFNSKSLGFCSEDERSYLKNCKTYHVPVDTNVLITLKTHWNVLRPTNAFSEGALLPLLDILSSNTHITKLVLAGMGSIAHKRLGSGTGNSNARLLGLILRKNTSITHLNLCQTGLDDNGLAEICCGLQENHTVTDINLSKNNFGPKGLALLQRVLSTNKNIVKLDISMNALGFPSVHSILSCPCARLQRKDINIEGNYVFEEILNSLSHGFGFILACIGAVVLGAESSVNQSNQQKWACTVYSSCLLFMFLSSALYHSMFMIPQAVRILKVLDHCAIYFLIAGSYCPIMVVGLKLSASAVVVLVMQWSLCFLGTVFTVCITPNTAIAKIVQMSTYLVMGLMMLCVLPEAIVQIPKQGLFLLYLGGFTYISGIPFFILDKKWPVLHSVWHMFVLSAAVMHWFCIYGYVLGS